MTDFPDAGVQPHGVISNFGAGALLGEFALLTGAVTTTTAWPASNRAVYCPVTLTVPATVPKLAIQVGTQSGNVDVGIYDEPGTRLVSSGSTAVGTTGLQVFDITDTLLIPGTYWLAMACDNTTATFPAKVPVIANLRVLGVQQQATAFPLPTTATFANPGSSFAPVIAASIVATI